MHPFCVWFLEVSLQSGKKIHKWVYHCGFCWVGDDEKESLHRWVCLGNLKQWLSTEDDFAPSGHLIVFGAVMGAVGVEMLLAYNG